MSGKFFCVAAFGTDKTKAEQRFCFGWKNFPIRYFFHLARRDFVQLLCRFVSFSVLKK
jgi:hypothetical protein